MLPPLEGGALQPVPGLGFLLALLAAEPHDAAIPARVEEAVSEGGDGRGVST